MNQRPTGLSRRTAYKENTENVLFNQKRGAEYVMKENLQREPCSDDDLDSSCMEDESEEEDVDSTTGFMKEFDVKNISNNKYVPRIAEFIYLNLFKEEKRCKLDVERFDEVQTSLNRKMRRVVVNWLINLHNAIRAKSSTLYNCIYYLDAVLTQHCIHKNDIQFVAAACFWEAHKFSELLPISYKDINEYLQEDYEIKDYQRYEEMILKAMDCKLEIPNQKQFLKRFLNGLNPSKELYEVCMFLCECSLLNLDLRKFLPSKIAYTIVLVGSFALNLPVSLPTLKSYAHKLDFDGLLICANYIIESAKYVLELKKGAIYQKYTSTKKTCVVLNLNFDENVYKNLKFLENACI